MLMLKIIIYLILGKILRIDGNRWQNFKNFFKKFRKFIGLSHTYPKELEEIINKLINQNKKICLIDVGANYGQILSLFKEFKIKLDRYVAFEPNPYPYNELSKSIKKYKFIKSFILFDSGIGINKEKIKFFIPFLGTLQLSGLGSTNKNSIEECLKIRNLPKKINKIFIQKFITIKEANLKIDKISNFEQNIFDKSYDFYFFKIDVQGSESDVLDSIFKLNLKNKKIAILIEVELDKHNKLSAKLASKNFRYIYNNGIDQLWINI